jgi:hypothetical protein
VGGSRLDSSGSGYKAAEKCCEHGNKADGCITFREFVKQLKSCEVQDCDVVLCHRHGVWGRVDAVCSGLRLAWRANTTIMQSSAQIRERSRRVLVALCFPR